MGPCWKVCVAALATPLGNLEHPNWKVEAAALGVRINLCATISYGCSLMQGLLAKGRGLRHVSAHDLLYHLELGQGSIWDSMKTQLLRPCIPHPVGRTLLSFCTNCVSPDLLLGSVRLLFYLWVYGHLPGTTTGPGREGDVKSLVR